LIGTPDITFASYHLKIRTAKSKITTT